MPEGGRALPLRVAVVGGGITGLATAWFLQQAGATVTVLEAADRTGGKIRTDDLAGVPVEAGPDTFLARVPWAVDLCRELGLGDDLVAPATGKAYLWTAGRILPLPGRQVLGVPTALRPLMRSGVVSTAGVARAALDLALPASTFGPDPSVAEVVGRRIVEQVPGTQVFAGTELADRNADNLRQGFLPILWVLVLVAFVVGTAIIGLIIYTATVEKTREYGVLKAIGFSNRRLYRIVLQQSLLAAMAGLVLGCILSLLLGPAVERIVPVFVTQIRVGDIVFASVGALIMAVVASFVPARRMARLDPAEVFRA